MLSKATRNWSLPMDKYDRMLLSALLEDGRASYAQLARTVNLSAPAVAERVAKLEASGVITGYQAKVVFFESRLADSVRDRTAADQPWQPEGV